MWPTVNEDPALNFSSALYYLPPSPCFPSTQTHTKEQNAVVKPLMSYLFRKKAGCLTFLSNFTFGIFSVRLDSQYWYLYNSGYININQIYWIKKNWDNSLWQTFEQYHFFCTHFVLGRPFLIVCLSQLSWFSTIISEYNSVSAVLKDMGSNAFNRVISLLKYWTCLATCREKDNLVTRYGRVMGWNFLFHGQLSTPAFSSLSLLGRLMSDDGDDMMTTIFRHKNRE